MYGHPGKSLALFCLVLTMSGCGDLQDKTGSGLDSEGDEPLVVRYSEEKGLVYSLVFNDGQPTARCNVTAYEKGQEVSEVSGEYTSCSVDVQRQTYIMMNREDSKSLERLTSNEALMEYRALDDKNLSGQCSHREGQLTIFVYDFHESDAQSSVYAEEMISFAKSMIQRCQNE